MVSRNRQAIGGIRREHRDGKAEARQLDRKLTLTEADLPPETAFRA